MGIFTYKESISIVSCTDVQTYKDSDSISFSSVKKNRKKRRERKYITREGGMYKKIYRYGISLNWNKIVRDLLYFIQFKWVSSQMYIYFKKRKKYWLNLN